MHAEEGPRCINSVYSLSVFSALKFVYDVALIVTWFYVTLRWAWVEFYYLRHLQEDLTASFFLDALLREY